MFLKGMRTKSRRKRRSVKDRVGIGFNAKVQCQVHARNLQDPSKQKGS